MKELVLLTFLMCLLFSHQLSAQSISKRGYPEHFVAGAIIGGTVSYYAYKKTNNKWKAWAFGIIASSSIGLLKEAVDPVIFNGKRSFNDFQYTALGGVIGASIIIPLRSRKE